MEFNNLESIISCIKEWDQIRTSPTDVITFLNTGNYFNLSRTRPTAQNLHAYPGISPVDNEMYMFVIDADDDKNSSEEDLFNAITICKVRKNYGNSDEIPEAEARRRMDNWNRDFAAWATAQINLQSQTQGIFKAFNIPSTYMEPNTQYATFFGLKTDSASPTGFDADLITTDSSKGPATYFDTVRPVPPFDVYSQGSFYLLSMV